MEFNFILNGKDVSVNCRPDARVSSILREHFSLLRVKNGCTSGQCGSCSIIYNNTLVSSCLLPAFTLKNCEIMTDEGFVELKERSEIIKVLKRLEVDLCDYCKPSRLLSIHHFLMNGPQNRVSTEAEILDALSGTKCTCTDPWSLVEVVQECQSNKFRWQHVIRK